VLRDPVPGPPFGCDREGFLSGFLGEIEIAEKADQGRQDAAPLAPEDVIDQMVDQKDSSVGIATSGRTSTAPPRRTAGMR
jgi:N-acetylmuramic acid 6-phosphate (MurNAc-6-P) etherase